MKSVTPNALAPLLGRAADALSSGIPLELLDQEARDLLAELDYAQPRDAAHNHVALLRAAAGLRRIFELPALDAPGLCFLGAEADPSTLPMPPAGAAVAGASGAGLSLQLAFESCVGEAVEYLSQFEDPQDALERGGDDARMVDLAPTTRRFLAELMTHRAGSGPVEWMPAVRLSDGIPAALPADICLRRDSGRRAITPPFMLGAGCAAGRSFEGACLHALLELIERDAASLWWRGGRRAGAIPLESDAQWAAASLLRRIRADARTRECWLLDITSDLGIPCVAAISRERGAAGFACGLAARLTLAAAAQSAIREMCQIELAYRLVAAKQHERGEAALNETDRRHRERSTRLNADDCLLLHPAAPRNHLALGDDEDAGRNLHRIVDALAGRGIEVFAINLTRKQFNIAVARLVAPGLQLEPSGITTERLRETIVQTGGGADHTMGVALL